MGTFHQHKHALHGITVVVEMADGGTVVGRCDDIDDHQVIVLDADIHRPAAGEPDKDAYLARAARFGVWPRHGRLVIARADVRAVERLGDLAS